MALFWSLKPHLVSKVWGGEKLKTFKKLKNFVDPLGESWEVSRLSEGSSSVEIEDSLVSIADLTSKEQLPYLVKFIDTSDNLSIQVHPGDSFAKKYEDSMGKTECWLVLDCSPGAGVYLGLKPNLTREELSRAIENKEDLSQMLNYFPAKRGDFFYVPSGSIHAIGSGVTLAEIQQSSGITYRVWDWNRLGLDGRERELHVEKGLKVIEFENDKNSSDYFKIKKSLFSTRGKVELVRHSDFNVDLFNLEKGESLEIEAPQSDRLNSFINLGESPVSIGGHQLEGYSSLLIRPDSSSNQLTCKQYTDKGSECSSFLHVY